MIRVKLSGLWKVLVCDFIIISNGKQRYTCTTFKGVLVYPQMNVSLPLSCPVFAGAKPTKNFLTTLGSIAIGAGGQQVEGVACAALRSGFYVI